MEEKIYCPQCGAANDTKNQFCGSCGGRIKETSPIGQPQTIAITPSTQQPGQVVYVQTQQPKKQEITVIGIIGLVIGIISLLVLSWVSLFSYLWMPFMYLGIVLIGIILSAISVRQNTAIGVTGLVTGILGGMAQIGWCIFAAIFYALGI